MRRSFATLLLTLAALPCIGEVVYLGDSKDLTCAPPDARTDGTPLNESEIGEYRWYETLGNTAAVRIQTTQACNFSYTFNTLGTVTVNVTAYAESGGESLFSNDKVFEVLEPVPDKPTKLQVVTEATP